MAVVTWSLQEHESFAHRHGSSMMSLAFRLNSLSHSMAVFLCVCVLL